MPQQASDRIMDRYRERRAAATGTSRSDVHVVDHEMIKAGTARFLVEFGEGLPQPAPQDCERAVSAAFNNLVAPVVGSVQYTECGRGAIVLGHSAEPMRPMREADAMVQVIAGSTYQDSHDNSLWDVEDSSSGKILRRRSPLALDDLLKQRQALPRRISLASVRVASARVQFGDTVRFYSGGNIVSGVVQSANEDNVTLLVGTDEVTIDLTAIIEVYPGSEHVNARNNEVESYWSKVLGPELASKLVNP